MRGFADYLIGFPNEFDKFINTGAQMQDSVYQMTLKLHFALNCHDFAIRKRSVFMDDNA